VKLSIHLASAAAMAIALVCVSTPAWGVTDVAQMECAFEALVPGHRRVDGPQALAAPKLALRSSRYEQFHTRVPLIHGAPAQVGQELAFERARGILAQELGAFEFPDGERPQVVIDANRGDLAIEVVGLDRTSAGLLSGRLGANQALHRVMGELTNHGVTRVQADVSDLLKLTFKTGGDVPYALKAFPNGKVYREYHYEPGVGNNKEFAALVDNSVEVIYMPKGIWGHMAVRVGSRYYSYGQVGQFVNREFLPFPGSRGFGFKVAPDKIPELIKLMEEITTNATKHNVPPYDVHSPQVELVKELGGGLRYRSSTPPTMAVEGAIIRNNERVDAKLVNQNGELFLRTPSGFVYPVHQRNGRMYVDALNCVGSVKDAVKRVGIDLALDPIFPKTVTDLVERNLEPGNVGGHTPDFVVDYAAPGKRAAVRENPQVEKLETPIPLNAIYEIHSISYPRGRGAGALYHVRPAAHADGLRALEGDKFVPHRTEMSDAPEFYKAAGFRTQLDPRTGEYWSEIPSAELMQENMDNWNALHKGDPNREIYLKYFTGGSHNQIAMSQYAAEGYVGMADPHGVHIEPYAVTNSAPPTPANHSRLILNPATGRVREFNGLFSHDVGHMANGIYVDKATAHHLQEMSQFYSDVHAVFDQKEVRERDLRVTNPEAMRIREALLKYTYNGRSPVKEELPGVAATRYVTMQMMYSQSSYHGYEHMLGWLIREKQGLDPATFNEQDRGSTFAREAVFHLMRLGVRAPGSEPFFMSPVGVLTFQNATDNQGPMTLERALGFIHNQDNERATTMLEDLTKQFENDPQVLEKLQTIRAKYALLLDHRADSNEIRAMAERTRRRYQALGGVIP
jgi:hypothetical protein